MAPAEVFDEWESELMMPAQLTPAVEDWDEELLVPAQGRLVYVGQGQCQYTYFHQPTPGLLWPKKKRKKKKAKSQPPSASAPEPVPPAPAPVDWEDWEEICPPAPREDWDAEIAASQPKEDWDAEIAASQ
jgi:hypothetical protein